MEFDLMSVPSFGVAGNFTGHLEQAGEAKDFVNVKTAEENAPKALFPTYVPGGCAPEFLHVYPFDSEHIIYPEGQDKLQIEPECGVIWEAHWEFGELLELCPIAFGASNDCSIRRDGATKISQKKNWGPSSKGFAKNVIPIDKFCDGGIMDDYRIASYLVRDGVAYEYGENSRVKDYSYMYGKLRDWIMSKLNNQKDEGPAENINSYMEAADNHDNIFVSIGATRYTEFGKTNFLKAGDKSVVVLYPESEYSAEDITRLVESGAEAPDNISLLCQTVITKS